MVWYCDALTFSERNSKWRQSVLCLLFCTATIVPAVPALAQERARVFLDCRACDFNYLRQEIQFVDYVRDRTDADVHVLATTQGTGGGGTAAPQTAAQDPWNLWTFQVRGSGSVNGEKRNNSRSLNTSFSANRTTDEWKLNSNVNLNFRENSYTLSDGAKFVDNSHDHNSSVLLVKSLGDHWAAALRGRWASTTFLNQDRSLRAAAGVEYSFFPYRSLPARN